MASEAPQVGPRRLIVLGSTGSIGTSTLEVAAHLERCGRTDVAVAGLVAGSNGAVLAEQIRQTGAATAGLADPAGAVAWPQGTQVHVGPDAASLVVAEAARRGDLVIAAMVGAAGIPAVLDAIERGCDVALANKETLVAAGEVVTAAVARCGVALLPVDSEHSAIFQCLQDRRGVDQVRRLVLTASGGPFRTTPAERLAEVTVAQALDHPTWDMGPKNTIDSATMMNKALEVIEAHYLFGLPAERIEVIVHPQSVVHSFVEFIDGSVLAQLGPPDMKGPIQYAVTWPDRVEGCAELMDWATLRTLEFEPVDDERFPAIGLARRVLAAGGTSGAIFNAANEVAVEAFLAGTIPFGQIARLVEAALDAIGAGDATVLDDVLAADARTRAHVARLIPSDRSAAESARARAYR